MITILILTTIFTLIYIIYITFISQVVWCCIFLVLSPSPNVIPPNFWEVATHRSLLSLEPFSFPVKIYSSWFTNSLSSWNTSKLTSPFSFWSFFLSSNFSSLLLHSLCLYSFSFFWYFIFLISAVFLLFWICNCYSSLQRLSSP